MNQQDVISTMQCMHNLMKADKFPVKVIGDNPLVHSNNSLIGVSGLQTYNDIWE